MIDDALTKVLGALADPTRRAIYERLLRSGDATATELSQHAAVTRQAIVKHLQVLAEAGLVGAERHGREVHYAAAPEATSHLVTWLDRQSTAWDRRLAKLVPRARSATRPTGP